MTYLEVAQTLEDFVEGKGHKWAWDDYLSYHHFTDPYLSDLQRRMDGLSDEFPAQQKGHYCGPEGIEIIRISIEELRRKAAENITTE
jgi:hypothetical protein